jgi:hypothetical protein
MRDIARCILEIQMSNPDLARPSHSAAALFGRFLMGGVFLWSGADKLLAPAATVALVWDLKAPPLEVRRNKHRLGSRVIERAAAQLAGSFDLEATVNAIAGAFAGPDLSALQEKVGKAQNRVADVLGGLYLPQLPTRHEIVRRALAMFADTPSMDVIVNRAQAVILDTIGARLSAMKSAYSQTMSVVCRASSV